MSKDSAGASQPTAARVGKYLMLDLLGEGAFGKVRLAVDERDGQQYAMKIMEKSHIKANELTLQVRREIAVMKAMRHPNIVNLREVLNSSKNLYMVMDLVTGGELFDAVAEAGKLPEIRARLYFQQLVDGIHYCHSRRVYHRDLKPENLLLTSDKQTIKITDFGLSSIKESNASSELLHTIMGSPHYIAPEIITSAAEGYDGAKVDVWASGIILFGMLAGFLPFDEPEMSELYRSIVRKQITYPPHFSYDVIKLIRAMLQKEPHKRPTMEQIKQFAWFRVNYRPALTDDHEATTSTAPRKNRPRQKAKKSTDKLIKARQRGSIQRMTNETSTLRDNTKIVGAEAHSTTLASNDAQYSRPVKKESRKSRHDSSILENREKVEHETSARSISQGSHLSTESMTNLRTRTASSDSYNTTSSTSGVKSLPSETTPNPQNRPPPLLDETEDGTQYDVNSTDMNNVFVYIETPMATQRRTGSYRFSSNNSSFKGSLSLNADTESKVNSNCSSQDRQAGQDPSNWGRTSVIDAVELRELTSTNDYAEFTGQETINCAAKLIENAQFNKNRIRDIDLAEDEQNCSLPISTCNTQDSEKEKPNISGKNSTPSNGIQDLRDHVEMEKGSFQNLFSPLHPAEIPFRQIQPAESFANNENSVENSVNKDSNTSNVDKNLPKGRGAEEFISPVSMTADDSFEKNPQEERNTEIDLNSLSIHDKNPLPKNIVTNQDDVKNEAREVNEGKENSGQIPTKSTIGIFKPVKSLFKPLSDTLTEVDKNVEMCKDTQFEEKSSGPLSFDEYCNDGDAFADVEADSTSMRWAQNPLTRKETGSVKFMNDMRRRLSSNMYNSMETAHHEIEEKQQDNNRNDKAIFGTLDSNLAVRLVPAPNSDFKGVQKIFGRLGPKPW